MQPSPFQLTAGPRGADLAVIVQGRIDMSNARRFLDQVLAAASRDAGGNVAADLSGVTYFDSAAGAALLRLRQELARRGRGMRITAATPAIEGFLSLLDEEALLRPPPPGPPEERWVPRIGGRTLQSLSGLRDAVVFTGELGLGLLDALRRPHRIRWRETILYMQRCGGDGLPIVALISFLMGLITAFQAAVQLQQFGADIYVANLVGLSIVRELGPLMTAIIAAGRSGAAFAAEIGTMQVSDEVDAITTMGLDRTRFLVTPKVLALLATLPCLTLFADLVGILGGLTVGVLWLDLPATVYLRQTRIALVPWDVFSGVWKSVVFALLIAGVACFRGFQARSGAESVGRITTSAIVASLFSIILADAVFTLLFHYW